MTGAVILLLPGLDVDKQLGVTVPYVEAAGYVLAAVVRVDAGQDVTTMLAAESIVVVAVADDRLRERVERAGAHLEAVHRPDYGRLTVKEVLTVLYRDEHWPVAKIAARFRSDPRDVVDQLRRAGFRKPQ